jgi:cold-inducible RNA-binding protein
MEGDDSLMGGNRLFVGNIPYSATDESLKQHFEQVGEVEEAKVIRYRDTGKSRGFGFVTMKTAELAKKAIEMLHNKPMKVGEVERNILVNEAKPMQDKSQKA